MYKFCSGLETLFALLMLDRLPKLLIRNALSCKEAYRVDVTFVHEYNLT